VVAGCVLIIFFCVLQKMSTRRTSRARARAFLNGPKPPTATQIKNAAEYEEHIAQVMPHITKNCYPMLVKYDINFTFAPPVVPLFEHAIGCKSRDPQKGLPIVFPCLYNEESAQALINYVDDLNVHNWGYPDGATAIHFRSWSVNECPFMIKRNTLDGDPQAGHMANTVFVCPGGQFTWGLFAATTTSNHAELMIMYDTIAGCTVPPKARTFLRDYEFKQRYSTLHIVATFEHPVDPEALCCFQTPGNVFVSTPPNPVENPLDATTMNVNGNVEFSDIAASADSHCMAPCHSGTIVKPMLLCDFTRAINAHPGVIVNAFVVTWANVLLTPFARNMITMSALTSLCVVTDDKTPNLDYSTCLQRGYLTPALALCWNSTVPESVVCEMLCTASVKTETLVLWIMSRIATSILHEMSHGSDSLQNVSSFSVLELLKLLLAKAPMIPLGSRMLQFIINFALTENDNK
jgi:hypothetical protein